MRKFKLRITITLSFLLSVPTTPTHQISQKPNKIFLGLRLSKIICILSIGDFGFCFSTMYFKPTFLVSVFQKVSLEAGNA